MAMLAIGLATQLNGLMANPLAQGAVWAMGCAITLVGVKYAIDVVGRERMIDQPLPEVRTNIYEQEQMLAVADSEVNSCTDADSFTNTYNSVDTDVCASLHLSPASNVPVAAIWGHPNTVSYTPAEPWNQALTLQVASGRVDPVNATSIALPVVLSLGVLGWSLRQACRNCRSHGRQKRVVFATKATNASASDHASSVKASVPKPGAVSHEASTPTASTLSIFSTDAPPPNWFKVTFVTENGTSMSPEVLQQRAPQGHAPSQPSKNKVALGRQLEQLKDKNSSLSQQMREYRSGNERLTTKNEILRREMNQLRSEIAQLTNKNKIYSQLAREHLENKEQLEKELADARDRSKADADLAKHSQEQLNQVNNDIDESNQLALKYLQDKGKAENELVDAQKTADIAKTFAEQLREQLNDSQGKTDTYAALAKQLGESLDQLKKEVRVNKETSDLRQKEIDILMCELENANQKLGKYKSSRSDLTNAPSGVIEMGIESDPSALQEPPERVKSGDHALEQDTTIGKAHGEESADAAIKSEQATEPEKKMMGGSQGPIDDPEVQSNDSQQIQSQNAQLIERPSAELAKKTSILPDGQRVTIDETPTTPSQIAISIPVYDATSALVAADAQLYRTTPDADPLQIKPEPNAPVTSQEKPGRDSPAAQTLASVEATDRPAANAPYPLIFATETPQTQQKSLTGQSPSEVGSQNATPGGEHGTQRRIKLKARAKGGPLLPPRTGLGNSRFATPIAKAKAKPPKPDPIVPNTQPLVLHETTAEQSNAQLAASIQPESIRLQAASILTASNPQRWECALCRSSYPTSLSQFTHRLTCDAWRQKHLKNVEPNSEMLYPPNFQDLALKPGPTADEAEWVRLNAQRLSASLQNLLTSQPQSAVPSPVGLEGGGGKIDLHDKERTRKRAQARR
ncbi:hypothetical protein SVAN01_01785 [Stagonosporopsis vannaccii]|nr:hypothetical protein SVAN01_01785 [Stagonosporopsis vannaccii]